MTSRRDLVRWCGIRADRGSGGALACTIAASALCVSLLALTLFSALPGRAGVQAAADSAAIAAAEGLAAVASESPCELARQTVEKNNALLEQCSLQRNEATVTATRQILGVRVSVTSRAGIELPDPQTEGGANGALPIESLTLVTYPGVRESPGVYLRPDAAAALSAMLEAYHVETQNYLPVDEGYRDLAGQQQQFNEHGWPRAAIPGTSNHGEAVAIDFVNPPVVRGDGTHEWLVARAADFGFAPLTDPDEPWHWDYVGLSELTRGGPR